MLETVVTVIAGAVNVLLGGTAFLLWQAIQSVKESISSESYARQEAEKRLQDEIIKVEGQITEQQRHASETYLRRDDYRDDMIEVKALIRQILAKLDDKADK